MAGGTFTSQNKTRPGVYINFESEAQTLGTLGERGTVTFALPLNWGPEKEVIELEASDNFFTKLGYNLGDSEILLVKEAFKRAQKLLLYRLNTGEKAKVTIGTLTATAKFGGTRGNDITIIIQANIDIPDSFDVRTIIGDVVVNSQTVAAISELVANDWVTFSGTGEITSSTGAKLTGGANGTVTNQDHKDYLDAVEVYEFNAIGLVATDDTLKALYAAFIKRLRDDEGFKGQLVLENYPVADYEGTTSVKNGVVLSDGTTLTASQAVAWVAAASAGANVNESLTYQAYEDAVDVSPRYTNSQIVSALKNGEFLFSLNKGRAIVEQDINTFKSFTPTKAKHFSKNRVVRVLDEIGNGFKRIFDEFYIGKVDNTEDGRNLLKNESNSFLGSLQGINALQNFDSETDVTIVIGNEADSVYAEVYVQPVDSIEKVYMKVGVR